MHPFTHRSSESVAALGEEKLIAAIRRWLGAVSPRAPFGIGDDCAVLPPSRGEQLITVDPVIYPRHFNDRVQASDVGAKLLKRNLSDLAAMGGRPTAAVLALTLAPTVKLAWLEQFYRGLAKCARRYAVPIVGGDIAQADGALAASLTLLGEPTGPRTLTRTGGRLGDIIYVTGELGGSLRSGHHFSFQPRLAEGAWLAERPEVLAMMDVSDGLAKDLHALTPRGTEPALRAEALPRRRRANLRAALTDGEDYELLFVVDRNADLPAFERAWSRKFPRVRLTPVGSFSRQGKRPDWAMTLDQFHGYEHLR
ncbi:MAG: thiamine-phosphate kinase [Opitutus sp.]